MNSTVRDLFYTHEGRQIHKWDHYFEVYEHLFNKYKGKSINLLEIGVEHGGSIELWKKYFGPNVNIYVIDINEQCKNFEENNVKIFIGSQSDLIFLNQTAQELPDLDIIIDDGGHTMEQQITSFENLYLKLKEGGLYVVEDTHTSYWHQYHGGVKQAGSFIEYSKNLIDSLYDGHIHDKSKILINDITRYVNGIFFYDSIVVFDKRERKPPFHIRVGKPTIEEYKPKSEHRKRTLVMRIKALFFGKVNTFRDNDKGRVEQRNL